MTTLFEDPQPAPWWPTAIVETSASRPPAAVCPQPALPEPFELACDRAAIAGAKARAMLPMTIYFTLLMWTLLATPYGALLLAVLQLFLV